MRRLWNFAVVSWSYPAQGKGGEIQRVEVQVVGQAPRRALRLAVPGPYRERVAHRRHRFQHPPDQQGEPDPPLQRGLGPRPRHLHRGRVLGHKEVRFHRPPMAVRLLTLSGRQLGRRTPDQQGPRIGGIIDAHHIQDRRMILLKMQGVAPHPDLALLPGPGEVLVRHHFGLGRPGMQNRPVRGRPRWLGGRGGGAPRSLQLMRNRPVSASRAVAAANCFWVAIPASTARSRGTALGGRSANTAATASSQLAPKRTRWTKPTRTPAIHTTRVAAATMLARTARPARCQDPLPNNAVRAVARQRAIVEESTATTLRLCTPNWTGSTGRFATHQVSARSNRSSKENLPRSIARSTRCHPHLRWKTKGRAARARLPLHWTRRPVIIVSSTTPIK